MAKKNLAWDECGEDRLSCGTRMAQCIPHCSAIGWPIRPSICVMDTEKWTAQINRCLDWIQAIHVEMNGQISSLTSPCELEHQDPIQWANSMARVYAKVKLLCSKQYRYFSDSSTAQAAACFGCYRYRKWLIKLTLKSFPKPWFSNFAHHSSVGLMSSKFSPRHTENLNRKGKWAQIGCNNEE